MGRMMFDSEWMVTTPGAGIQFKILNSLFIILTVWIVRYLIGQFIDRRVDFTTVIEEGVYAQ